MFIQGSTGQVQVVCIINGYKTIISFQYVIAIEQSASSIVNIVPLKGSQSQEYLKQYRCNVLPVYPLGIQ